MKNNYVILAVSNDDLELPKVILLNYQEMQDYSGKPLKKCYSFIHNKTLDKTLNCRYIKVELDEEIELTKNRIVKRGRPNATISESFKNIAKQYFAGDIACDEAIKISKVSRSTFFRNLGKIKTFL